MQRALTIVIALTALAGCDSIIRGQTACTGSGEIVPGNNCGTGIAPEQCNAKCFILGGQEAFQFKDSLDGTIRNLQWALRPP